MTPEQIRQFLSQNEIALRIVKYIRNYLITERLKNGKLDGVSSLTIIRNVPELNSIENPKEHLRVLGKMGLLKSMGYSGRWRGAKTKTQQIWTVEPIVSDIVDGL